MADAPHWTDIALVAIALMAAVVACFARSDSKKSAAEAARARKIAQSDLLAPHFTNIDGIVTLIKKRNKFDTTSDKIILATESATYLKNFLVNDSEMQTCLVKINEMLTKPHPYSKEALYAASSGFSVDRFYSEYGEIIKIFECKQREYLSIG